MGSTTESSRPFLSFGVVADVQYADTEDGYNFSKTNRRYYRAALKMLDKAISLWNNDKIVKPGFVLQLGDAIDGRNKGLNMSQSSLDTILKSFARFNGPVYHIWGNHEYYNFTREELLRSNLFSGNEKYCSPVSGKVYFSCIPHRKLRILALDCYEVSLLASPKDSKDYITATQIMKNNNNKDKNSCAGMFGESQRFVKFNGAISDDQLVWMEQHLKEARSQKQNVIIMGHCGIYKEATDNSCLLWNAPDVLDLVQRYSDCVVTFLSGHDHVGGSAVDDTGILHIAFPGVIENNEQPDCGTFYMYRNCLELMGCGRVPDFTLPLRFYCDSS